MQRVVASAFFTWADISFPNVYMTFHAFGNEIQFTSLLPRSYRDKYVKTISDFHLAKCSSPKTEDTKAKKTNYWLQVIIMTKIQ